MVRKRPWSGPVGSRRELLRLEWPPRQLNEGGRKLNVKIKRLHPDAVTPAYAKPGDSGFDLVAVSDVIIAPGETVLVPTGLAVEVPEGYELQIRPRSGITLKTKLRVANSPGTVDSSYRGEIAVIVDNISLDNWSNAARRIDNSYEESTRNKCVAGSYVIRKGDRIAQGVIAPVERVTFTEVDELGATERGSGGFGHSGVRTEVDG